MFIVTDISSVDDVVVVAVVVVVVAHVYMEVCTANAVPVRCLSGAYQVPFRCQSSACQVPVRWQSGALCYFTRLCRHAQESKVHEQRHHYADR